jgi:hypothetical protein
MCFAIPNALRGVGKPSGLSPGNAVEEAASGAPEKASSGC